VEELLSNFMPSAPPGLPIESHLNKHLMTEQLNSLDAKVDFVDPDVKAETNFQEDPDQLLQRVEMLEKIYVLTDWEAIEQASYQMVRPSHSEPELEMSPLKPNVANEDSKCPLSLPSQCLSFDIYSEIDDAESDTLADALAIVDRIKDELFNFRSKYDHETASDATLFSSTARDCRNHF